MEHICSLICAGAAVRYSHVLRWAVQALEILETCSSFSMLNS